MFIIYISILVYTTFVFASCDIMWQLFNKFACLLPLFASVNGGVFLFAIGTSTDRLTLL